MLPEKRTSQIHYRNDKPMKCLAIPLLLLFAAATSQAQVFTPKEVDLNVSFDNADPSVTALMAASGGPGLLRVFFTATTDPVPPGGARQAIKNYDATDAFTAPTVFSVDDTVGGLTYSAQVLCELKSGQQYYFPLVNGLSTADPNPVWSIQNTGTIVNFNFVDGLGAPVQLDGGIIIANDAGNTVTAPSNLYLPSGSSSATFLARGGSNTVFVLYADLGGTDPAVSKYSKKFTISDFEVAPLPADTVQHIDVVIDAAADTSGSLSGRFDVTLSAVSPNELTTTDDGFFEIYAPTPSLNDGRPNFPILHTIFNSGDGYGNWEREKSFIGTNFTDEASGAFTSSNLLPSPPPGQGFYSVFGETFLRRTVSGDDPGVHRLQFLRTPILGSGSNLEPQIPSGNLDIGDTFVIKPGYLTGSLSLAGPEVVPGQPALLAHVLRSTDGDTTGDGIPDTDVTEWFNGSTLYAYGVDEAAPGFSSTASGGESFVPLPGSFDPLTGDFTGSYDFALGGLNGDSAFWKTASVTLSLVNNGSSADTYFNTFFTMIDRTPDATARREIGPNVTAVSNVSHEFGEVSLRIRAVSGTIYEPQIHRVIDDPEQPLNPYLVQNFSANGWPQAQADAATTATVRTLMPAGSWVITPRINPGDQAAVDLLPIGITVPARGRLSIETGFRLVTTIPACLTGPSATITGSVVSAPIPVSEISYSIDGGPPILVSNPNVADPTFSIDLSALADGHHSITITATGPSGEESSLSTSFHRAAVGLTIQKAVILTWGCGVLQTSTDMQTWSDVPGATSPFAVPTNEPSRFWQVRYE